jgi:hypothetical protein
MSELTPPINESLFIADGTKLVTSPAWIQWFIQVASLISNAVVHINNATDLTIAAGDLLKGASVNTLEALAKGAANSTMFMNSAGTSPEWANGLYAGYITRGMTDTGAPTDVNYTGLPFKPSALILSMSLGNASISVGFADASNSYVQVIYGAATTYYHPNDSTCIWILEESGKEQKASLKTFNSDGFTLTWTKVGSPAAATCHGYYIAIR